MVSRYRRLQSFTCEELSRTVKTDDFTASAFVIGKKHRYTGLQGGSIMRGWMKEENTKITCCSDGTSPVIFKIERLDYEG